MSTVQLCGPNNSTMFTTCCNLAILPHQGQCPGCKVDVEPFYQNSEHQTSMARWNRAYGPYRSKRLKLEVPRG